MATTSEYLNELIRQRDALAAALEAEGVDASTDETFNTLVAKINQLHGTDQSYDPESPRAQSGVAVAEGIEDSVGDINGALKSLVEPSEIDPGTWMDETVAAAVEEIKEQNEATIADQIEAAVSNLSAENEATIKQQVADAVDNLDASVRRSFLANAKRLTNGRINFEANTIYVIVRVPDGNSLTVYDCDTLAPVTLSDRHYCIIVGNSGDDVADAVCATVISYPTLSPQLYVVKNSTLQGTMSWTGTAIVSVVKNGLAENA